MECGMISTTVPTQARPVSNDPTREALSRVHPAGELRNENSPHLRHPSIPPDSPFPRHGLKKRAASAMRSFTLKGPAGRLEAVLNSGAPDAPFAALICHPHPVFGGNLHNKVVYHAMKAMNDPQWGRAWPVLRFNFRGMGRSEGRHDGEAETGDVLAAVAWLKSEFDLPIVIAGFSFGAAMALRACSIRPESHDDVRALIAIGLPTEVDGPAYHYPFLSGLGIRKLFLSGDRDPFAPAAELARIVASAAEPKHLIFVRGADHFFTDRLEPMQEALSRWLKEQM
jgi:uncharacterized protein